MNIVVLLAFENGDTVQNNNSFMMKCLSAHLLE